MPIYPRQYFYIKKRLWQNQIRSDTFLLNRNYVSSTKQTFDPLLVNITYLPITHHQKFIAYLLFTQHERKDIPTYIVFYLKNYIFYDSTYMEAQEVIVRLTTFWYSITTSEKHKILKKQIAQIIVISSSVTHIHSTPTLHCWCTLVRFSILFNP